MMRVGSDLSVPLALSFLRGYLRSTRMPGSRALMKIHSGLGRAGYGGETRRARRSGRISIGPREPVWPGVRAHTARTTGDSSGK